MVSFNLEMGTLAEHVNTRPRRMAIEDHSDFLRYHRRSKPSPSPGGEQEDGLQQAHLPGQPLHPLLQSRPGEDAGGRRIAAKSLVRERIHLSDDLSQLDTPDQNRAASSPLVARLPWPASDCYDHAFPEGGKQRP